MGMGQSGGLGVSLLRTSGIACELHGLSLLDADQQDDMHQRLSTGMRCDWYALCESGRW